MLGLQGLFLTIPHPELVRPRVTFWKRGGACSKGTTLARQSCFWALPDVIQRGQPTTNWALLNAGISHLLCFDEEAAMTAFAGIVSHGVYSGDREDLELISFFLDAAKQVQSRDPLRSEQVDVFAKGGYQSVGFLVLGLRRWGLGDLETGAEWMRKFDELAISCDVEWVRSYRKLVAPFLRDATTLDGVPVEPEPGSSGERQALREFLEAGALARDELRIHGGPHSLSLSERLERADQRLIALNEAARERDAMAASKKLDRDRLLLYRQIDGLRSVRDRMRFGVYIDRLRSLDLESERGLQERNTWVQIVADARAFVVTLGKMRLEPHFSGPVVRREGSAVVGEAFRVTDQALRVESSSRADVVVPFSECDPSFLLSLGEQHLRHTADSDLLLEEVRQMLSFARLFELQDTVATQFKILAGVGPEIVDPVQMKILSD